MATVLFSVWQQSDGDLLRHALVVEVDLGDVMSALQDGEIGQRGYLLTGDDVLLDPYRAGSRRIDALMGRLGAAVSGDPGQVEAFQALRSIVDDKRAELAASLALRERGDVAGALAVVKGKSGVAMMDRIRGLIEGMDAEQDRLVGVRQAALRMVRAVTAVVTALSVALMGLVARAALNEVRKRARLAHFLPVEVSSRLADGDRVLRDGRSGPATVAFVDIRGSTALAETLAPAALSRLLTGFRAAVSSAALRHGGMVDKFIGDGALVVFGALDADPAAAARSLAFARTLLASRSDVAGPAAFGIGIGVHHGEVFCGIVGDEDRQEFTVLGDAVNVASRIERATRVFATDLLISDVVLRLSGEDPRRWVEVSREPLRGRQGSLALLAERGAIRPAQGHGDKAGAVPSCDALGALPSSSPAR